MSEAGFTMWVRECEQQSKEMNCTLIKLGSVGKKKNASLEIFKLDQNSFKKSSDFVTSLAYKILFWSEKEWINKWQ